MICKTSSLSLYNTSIQDRILEAIEAVGDALKSINLSDMPSLWQSFVDGLKDVGKTLLNKLKDFFIHDVPGLIKDVWGIIQNLKDKEYDKAAQAAQSALDHFRNILEVLSLIPLCAVICSILLAAIYFCQKDWFNAVCALL